MNRVRWERYSVRQNGCAVYQIYSPVNGCFLQDLLTCLCPSAKLMLFLYGVRIQISVLPILKYDYLPLLLCVISFSYWTIFTPWSVCNIQVKKSIYKCFQHFWSGPPLGLGRCFAVGEYLRKRNYGVGFDIWGESMGREIQCPLDIVTLDITAALPVATLTPMDLDHPSLQK